MGDYKARQRNLTDITKKLAFENIPNNVRINAVSAGLVATDISPNPFITHSPLGKTATPFDVTAAVMFLASDDAAVVTGMNLPVDVARSVRLIANSMLSFHHL